MNLFSYMIPFIVTGLTVSILHAAIPTHWLPFVLAARTQKWSYRKLIAVLSIAGFGHIITTTAIGAMIVWFSIRLKEGFGSILVSISAAAIFLFGSYYVIQFLRGKRHSHCDHDHPHEHDFAKSSKDGWAILSLLTLLTFSPCEAFIPVYISAWQTGWQGFAILSIVLAVGTLASMILLTSLAFFGFKQLKLKFIENYEKLIIGIMMMALGIILYIVESGHNHVH